MLTCKLNNNFFYSIVITHRNLMLGFLMNRSQFYDSNIHVIFLINIKSKLNNIVENRLNFFESAFVYIN